MREIMKKPYIELKNVKLIVFFPQLYFVHVANFH